MHMTNCSTESPQGYDVSPSLLHFFLVPLEQHFSSLACTFESLKYFFKCQCPGLTCRDLIQLFWVGGQGPSVLEWPGLLVPGGHPSHLHTP